MTIRGRALALASAGMIVFAVALSAGPTQAQEKDKKLDKAQRQDAEELSAAVAAMQAGGAAPSDMALGLESYHFFKTSSGDTYVAFTATVDGKVLTSPAVALMIRVVNRNAATVPAAVPTSTSGGDRRTEKGAVAYEDFDFGVFKPAEQGQPSRLSRAFQVPGGDYDLYFGAKERSTGDKKQKTKVAVCRQPISVPDYRGGDVVTSSIVAGDVRALEKPLPADQQHENPYTIGRLQIVPKVGTKYATSDELSIYFQIYNERLDAAGKPNVQIDYLFYQKQADTEKKIANSEPQILNANTLTPIFDATKHQLAGGESWPLTKFKPGDYRLEVTITDKISGKVVTRSVGFSVS